MTPTQLPTYIGFCCREWVMAILAKPGRCGYCGEVPTFLRDDPDSYHHESEGNTK